MAGYIGQVLYACLWTETESPKKKTNGANIQLSLPNKLGQERIDYMEKKNHILLRDTASNPEWER